MKNENRIVSPHLNIYNLELQSGLSILNRICGLIFAFYLFYLLNYVVVYENLGAYHFFYTIQYLESYFNVRFNMFIFSGIFLILFLHIFCGIRHIIWDLNLGLTKHLLNLSSVFILIFLILINIFILIYLF
uniref:Succinate dehydrogenase subunit 3 n=1 Tax=Cyanophora biloba TaxID=1489483 RepID=A0A873WRL8_9EUKA|nr:succinate dehydrogenase subunit 3 [Cyanophora biloba]QPB15025.1 succinate dehydrogenase subunit 3 [Cyanophora biloba]